MISREELEYIVRQMSHKNMYEDLAMMFVTQDYMTSDDIFINDFYTEPEFYINVFKSILSYSTYKIKNYRSDEVCRDVLMKLSCITYETELIVENQLNREAILSEFIEKLLVAFQEFGSQQDLSVAVALIRDNPNIAPSVLKNILINNRRLDSLDVFLNIMSSGYFNFKDTIDLLIHRNTYTDYTTIDDFLYRILLDENTVIPFMYAVMERFILFQNPDGSISVYHRSQDKNEIDLLNHLREFLFNYIFGVAETELFTLVNSIYTQCKNENNAAMQMIYNKYQLWVTDVDRFNTRVQNYIDHHYEEPVDMYDEEIWHEFRYNPNVIMYIADMETSTNFGVFIKCFNINRLRLFKDGNSETAKLTMDGLMRDPDMANYVMAGVDLNVYYFLDLKGVKPNGTAAGL